MHFERFALLGASPCIHVELLQFLYDPPVTYSNHLSIALTAFSRFWFTTRAVCVTSSSMAVARNASRNAPWANLVSSSFSEPLYSILFLLHQESLDVLTQYLLPFRWLENFTSFRKVSYRHWIGEHRGLHCKQMSRVLFWWYLHDWIFRKHWVTGWPDFGAKNEWGVFFRVLHFGNPRVLHGLVLRILSSPHEGPLSDGRMSQDPTGAWYNFSHVSFIIFARKLVSLWTVVAKG